METQKIRIPENWNEVSLGTYQEIANIKTESDAIRLKETIFLLTGVDITKIPVTEINKITTNLQWLNSLPDDKNLKTIIVIDSVQYSLIGKFESISLGEWIDLEEFIKDHVNNLHKIMAVIYRPVINGKLEDYDTESLYTRAELFEDKMFIGDVYATMIFFFVIGMNFTKAFSTSLEAQL